MCDFSQYCLLRARAGSGKTTTLIYKLHLLFKKLQYAHNQVILLAFNRNAAKEINERIRDNIGIHSKNAMTFHSLAGRILSRNEGKYQEEEDDEEISDDHFEEDENEKKYDTVAIRNVLKSVM